MDANWKVAVENSLECYHCPTAHPTFQKVVDVSPDAYQVRQEGYWVAARAPVRPSAVALSEQGGPFRPSEGAYDVRGEIKTFQANFIWPNVSIGSRPGPLNAYALSFLPVTTERMAFVRDFFFGEDVGEAWIADLLEFTAPVAEQDRELVESVQRGLRCGLVDHGQFLPSSEGPVINFNRRVYEAVTKTRQPGRSDGRPG